MKKESQSQRSAKLQKLQGLVQRATIYSKFLADKLANRQEEFKAPLKESLVKHLPKKKKEIHHGQPEALTGCTLRDYQLVGMEWLVCLYENGLNGILADEMGLGKTLQTIAFFAHLRSVGTFGPFLVVAPLSTISNWKAEFSKFAPSLPTLLYHGTPNERANMRSKDMKGSNVSSSFPIIITSYELVMNDKKYLHKIPWKYIVVDEGHRIKNMNCKLILTLKSYTSANRLLLTGTPLQNNLKELWSLLNFLLPEIFDDLAAFEEWFEFENDIENVQDGDHSTSMVNSLHQILNPFLLRRIKTEVVKDLPKKREYILYAPLMPKQVELYDAILKKKLALVLEKNMSKSYQISNRAESNILLTGRREKRDVCYEEDDDSFDAKPIENSKSNIAPNSFIKRMVGSQNLQMTIMQLRKVCNHPYLFHIESENEAFENGIPEVIAWSGKMFLLETLLDRLLLNGHSVVIFSQMTSMLDIIGDWFTLIKNIPFCRIDGEVSMTEREAQIHDFNTKVDLRVFLLSTRAGGLGINLTAADTVIIFDSDWNPQVDLQAQDRVHRIGQTRPVIVYRFVTAHTVEGKILERARSKRVLEKVVIHKSKAFDAHVDKFKGSKNYYQGQDGTLDLNDLLLEETASISSATASEAILSEKDLVKITDRSDAAFLDLTSSNTSSINFEVVDAPTVEIYNL